MDIILKETIDNLGQEGDLVKVKPGYARNYLLPQQKAVLATEEAIARLEEEKQAIAARLAEQKKIADQLAVQIEGKTIIINRRVGAEDRLFGSVTSTDIAEALAGIDVTVDRRNIVLSDPIKTLGEFTVVVKVGYQQTASMTVQVAAETEGEKE